MNAFFILPAQERREIFWALTTTVIITTLLFCVDEGKYNFEWVTNGFNWIAFAIYAIGILFGQIIVNLLLLRKYKGKYKLTYTCVFGTLLGLVGTIALLI